MQTCTRERTACSTRASKSVRPLVPQGQRQLGLAGRNGWVAPGVRFPTGHQLKSRIHSYAHHYAHAAPVIEALTLSNIVGLCIIAAGWWLAFRIVKSLRQ